MKDLTPKPPAEIVPTLTTIKQAAEAGELDSAIESVTASIARKPK